MRDKLDVIWEKAPQKKQENTRMSTIIYDESDDGDEVVSLNEGTPKKNDEI